MQIINYTGHKMKRIKDFKQIINASGCTTFIDLFGGSGCVGFDAVGFPQLIGGRFDVLHYNDKNKIITNLIHTIINSNDFISTARFMNTLYPPRDEDAYYALRDKYNSLTDKESVYGCACLFILQCRSFSKVVRFNKSGGFNVPYGNRDNFEKLISNIGELNTALFDKMFVVTSHDFDDIIGENNPLDSSEFVFVDPPYDFTDAPYNMGWTENDTERLLQSLYKLHEQGIKWMLTTTLKNRGIDNQRMIDFSKDFNVVEIGQDIGFGNSFHKKSSEQTLEVAIYNYDA